MLLVFEKLQLEFQPVAADEVENEVEDEIENGFANFGLVSGQNHAVADVNQADCQQNFYLQDLNAKVYF